ncbi:MAG TPA: FHA domain-containing protein, partial [Blastocatellia bacterium]|nr:FHA domain-containing protein [Blastocatellia bacterium]
PEPPAAKPIASQPERVISALNAPHIEIEVTFDESNAEAPKGAPPRKFSLYDEESLIGRRSRSIPQTLGLEGDDGVSRRHLLIIRQADGSYVARLFDNTNGGTLNDTEMTAGVEAPLVEGDKIAIGAFTIVRVNAIR